MPAKHLQFDWIMAIHQGPNSRQKRWHTGWGILTSAHNSEGIEARFKLGEIVVENRTELVWKPTNPNFQPETVAKIIPQLIEAIRARPKRTPTMGFSVEGTKIKRN